MPIPVLPLTCSVYRPWGTMTLKHAGVSCRLVPKWWGGRKRTTGPGMLQFTHYIDLPAGLDMVGGLESVSSNTTDLSMNTFAASFIVIPAAHPRHVFLVCAAEDRYIGTPDAYMRVYVIQRSNNMFP